MIALAIAVGLATTYAFMRPLSDGLLDTSMWIAKTLAPVGVDDGNLLIKTGQGALMHGWLSNVPFVGTLALVGSSSCPWL